MKIRKLGLHHRQLAAAKRNDERDTRRELSVPLPLRLHAAPQADTDFVPPAGETALQKDAAPFEWLEAFDETNEPIFVHDKQFRILRCNSAYATCAGQPMEAIIGKPYWQVFPKLPQTRGRETGSPSVEQIETGSEFTTAAGEVFLTRDITAHRTSGESWYSRHSLENITDRKRSEEAQDRKTSFLEAIVGSAPGIFTVVNRQGKLVRWNAGLNTLTGYSDAELQEAAPLSFVADEDKGRMEAKREEAFLTGHAQGEIRIQSASQGTRELMFTAQRFEIEGEPFVATFCIDHTDIKQLERDLVREKLISDTIIESAPGAFFMIDEAGHLVRWNKFLQDECGLSDEQLHGCSVLAAIEEEDRPLAAAKFLSAFATGYAEMEVRAPTGKQGVRYFFKTARRFDVDGIPYVAGYCVDVTKRKQVEESLAAEKAFFDSLIESTPGAFFVLDQQGNYFRWNSYLNRLTGLSDQELTQRTFLLTIDEADRPLAATTIKGAMEHGYAQAELHLSAYDRGARLYFMTVRRFRVADATYLVGVGIDTTDRHAKMIELEHEAQTDSLTQVANRSRFMELAKHEFARCRRYGHPLSLWMLDVDHFKVVNDTYGHHAGDVALRSLVATSRQALRDWDILGRMGGEEFAVLLPETDSLQALQVAERFRQSVSAASIPIEDDKAVHLTVSAGIATSGDDDDSVEALLVRADAALYQAKQTGRDKVCMEGSARSVSSRNAGGP